MIVAAALGAGCGTLYSEDMQHGMTLDDGVRIVDPFRGWVGGGAVGCMQCAMPGRRAGRLAHCMRPIFFGVEFSNDIGPYNYH